MKQLFVICFLLIKTLTYGQGFNHQWLLGSYNFLSDPKGRIMFDTSTYSLINENRKMVFKGTEANISDANGNLLMSSNGVWIANANNDTMLNGSGLNPNGITPNWSFGLPMTSNNLFLPYPDDSNKFILFHHTATFDGYSYPAYEIFFSIIDITLDSGLGGVVFKNDTAIIDTLNWGLAACKHANGRDWWVIASKHNTDSVFKILFTPSGIQSITIQKLNVPKAWYDVMQPVFTNDGTHYSYYVYDSATISYKVLLFDFDRCSGSFSNPIIIPVTVGENLWGLAFSSSGKYLYTCSSNYIFQINVASLTVDTVSTYDGFISPVGTSCCATSFWNMYLAANGKIYITSGSGVQHLHEMNFPDSAGMACNVQQHSINLGYAQLRAVPNHPNYYLGCDTTSGCPCLYTSIEENSNYDFHFKVYPNPVTSNSFHIGYLLPQNKSGTFQIHDVTGKLLFKYTLPQWSNEQSFSLPTLSNGVYNCVITSNNFRASKKLVVIRE